MNATNYQTHSVTPHGATPAGRRALLANGYEPIPISGKRPLWEGWRDGPITADRLEAIEREHADHANTGLRCGRLAVVDVDIRDPDHVAAAVEAINATMGETMVQRIGSKGVALCYFNPEPIAKISVNGKAPNAKKASRLIEFLGEGQQVAAFGIHPDTGKPYEWPNDAFGCDPLGTPLADLPKVSPSKLRDAAAALADKLVSLGYSDVEVSESGMGREESKAGTGEPVTAEMLESMLRYVDPGCDRMRWIAVAGAIKSANVVDAATLVSDSDFDGRALFTRWSAGELHDEHAPSNFKGAGDCDETWDSVSTTRRGGSTLGSLIFLARRGGYSGSVRVSLMDRYDLDFANNSANDNNSSDAAETGSVRALNERYAVVTRGRNSGRVVDLTDPAEPQFLPKDRLNLIYANKRVPIATPEGMKKVPISALWMTYEERREITDIGFEPPGSEFPLPEGSHNIWRGFAVEPKAGESHEPLLEHISENVCRGDQALYTWFISWLADLVQRPGDKPGVAVALRGEPGAGKSVIYEYLRRLFGRHAMKISRPEHLTGRFNSHMAGLTLLGVEESFWAGDKNAEGVLKDLITAPEMAVEQKFADPLTLHNHVHLLVMSNEQWAVPAAPGDRRWAVFDVDSSRRNDRAFWTPIFEALKEGDGAANLLHYLAHVPYQRATLFRPPMTTAKAEQTIRSLGTIERWWLDVLRDERNPAGPRSPMDRCDNQEPPDGVFGAETAKDKLLTDYEAWCKSNGRRLDDARLFWRTLRTLTKNELRQYRPKNSDGSRPRVVWLPPRAECRLATASAMGCDWADLASDD
jgi:hypothetical protein